MSSPPDRSKTRSELASEVEALRARVARLDAEIDAARADARSEDRYRSIAENAGDLIAEIDATGRVLFVSASCATFLGRAPEEIVGRSIRDVSVTRAIHPEERERMRRVLRDGAPAGRTELEFRIRHTDGRWRWMHAKGRTYRGADGRLRAVVVSRDVTDRVEAQQALRESEERYRIVTEATREMISEMDSEGRLTYATPTVKDVLGYAPDEVIGTTPFPLIHPDDVERVAESFLAIVDDTATRSRETYRIRHRDGSWRWVEGTLMPYRRDGEVRFVGVSRDVTEARRVERERREFELRVQHAQKLESLGGLAGGIAHDFNNLLTPILGDAGLALMDLPRDSLARPRLQRIQRSATRAAKLTNQMLAYAGSGPLQVDTIDLSALVREMAQLLQSAVKGEAVFELDLGPDLPPVTADASQLRQVVLNLVTNASEAITGPGRITLRTGAVDAAAIGPLATAPGEELAKGTYVFLEVVDTGCGMDAETQARVFDPFFTTKFTGRGLGLAAVLGIVRVHRGAIDIDSTPREGTRFCVLLPEAPDEAAQPVSALLSEGPAQDGEDGEATLLVVDDDDGVRELTEETLRRAGFSVLCAPDGERGIELFRAHADEIDLVLLDRTMPTTGGEQVFAAMRAIRPDARIVLVSGYSENRASQHFERGALAGFLQKPFLPEVLIERVRALLEDARRSA